MWLVAAVVGSLFLSAAAEPVEKSRQKERKQRFAKVTNVDFGELAVSALPDKPGLIEIREVDRPTFHPFSKLRKDFDVEMRQSVDEVK